MLRSMYAGVSGLNAHQQMMDVTGNNISNVNTIGFKSSRVTFKEMLNQTIQGASAPQGNRAGTNPQQVGLGVGVGSIDSDMSSGNLQSTGKTSDVAIQGDGFFVLRDGTSDVYSRAGNFNFDENGNLYSSSTGLLVQGWQTDRNGRFQNDEGASIQFNDNNLESIKLKKELGASATNNIEFGKNLDANSISEADVTASTDPDLEAETRKLALDVYDSQGGIHTLELPITKTDNNLWEINQSEISLSDIDGSISLNDGSANHELNFDEDGRLESGKTVEINFQPLSVVDEVDSEGDPISQTIELDFSSMTQFAGEMTANYQNSDGYKAGALESFSFTETGDIVGSYDNGLTQIQAKLALANFQNPAGLTRNEGVFTNSSNSGYQGVSRPGNDGMGTLAPATLEMSNANLSKEFTNMITAQRGFQASSKLITTSDEMLQELVNLKR